MMVYTRRRFRRPNLPRTLRAREVGVRGSQRALVAARKRYLRQKLRQLVRTAAFLSQRRRTYRWARDWNIARRNLVRRRIVYRRRYGGRRRGR